MVRKDDPAEPARLARTPLGRIGLLSDNAEVALSLLTDRSAFITGADEAGVCVGAISGTSWHDELNRRQLNR